MKKVFCLISICICVTLGFANQIFTTSPIGSSLTFDDFSVISNFTVGTNPPNIPFNYLNMSTSFLVMNGSVPVEANSTNFQNWNNDPAAPYAGAFFIPGIHEDWSYDAGSTNVWSNVTKYQSGDINLIGGVGNKLFDPSPTLGAPYCEWLPVCQFTNLSETDLTIKLFRYMRPITTAGGAFYSNHGSHPYDYDYDGIDGTLDDFVASYIPGVPSCFWPAGCPIDRYRLQNFTALTMYDAISGGGADYSLTNKTDYIASNICEVGYQYKVHKLKQNQSLLYWIYPKPILINNSAQNHPSDINYFTRNITATGNYDFTGTNLSANYTVLTFKSNGGGIPATAVKTSAVEIVGGMIESDLGAGINSIYTGKYWELFYDTRRLNSTADISFTYPDDAVLTSNSDYLCLAYRTDYDQQWTTWKNFTHDPANRKLTATGYTGGDTQWAVACSRFFQPSNVVVMTATSSQIDLSWNAVAGATLYKIYRSADPYSGFGAVPIGTSATTTYKDTDVSVGNKYFYYITADNIAK